MLQHTTFKSAIPVIIGEYRESKSKAAREKCLVYLNTILTYWDLVDKEGDQIDDIVRLGLADASMKGRELAREAFISFRNIFPEKAERLKASLSASVLSRVVKAETKYDNRKKISLMQKEKEASQMIPRSASDEDLDIIMSNNTHSARKQEDRGQDNAINSIQALIHGNSQRKHPERFSILQNPLNSSGEYLDDNMEPVALDNEFVDDANENVDSSGHEMIKGDNSSPMMEPLYLQKQHQNLHSAGAVHSPHASTWYEADQISPLTMDNGHGRNSHENGHHLSPQRQTMSPTKSPPAPAVTKVKSASLG
jgi:hypothetical protein